MVVCTIIVRQVGQCLRQKERAVKGRRTALQIDCRVFKDRWERIFKLDEYTSRKSGCSQDVTWLKTSEAQGRWGMLCTLYCYPFTCYTVSWWFLWIESTRRNKQYVHSVFKDQECSVCVLFVHSTSIFHPLCVPMTKFSGLHAF